jgi:hypothetical protein
MFWPCYSRRPMSKTLHDHFETYLGKGNAEGLVDYLREILTDHPELVAELLPGMVIRPRPLTTQERAMRATRVAVAARRKEASERHAAALIVIKQALDKNPDISLRRIAAKLDAAGVTPQRGGRWSAASVMTIMRKAGIGEQTET